MRAGVDWRRPTKTVQRPPDLGAGELEVLRVLWDGGPATVREVHHALGDRGRQLAYNTVQTVLRRLLDKRFVTRNEAAAPQVFRARVTREQFGRRRLRDLVREVYDGAAGSLAVQLLRTGKFEPGELEELQQLLDEAAEKRGRRAR